MTTLSFRRLAAVSLAGAAFLAAPAAAQTRDDAVAWCLNKQHTFTPDLVVRGCTSLLQVRNAPANIAAEAYRLRGDAYYDQKDYALAIADYSAGIRLDSSYDGLFNDRGLAYQATGDLRRAMDDYGEAIRLAPGNVIAHANRGRLLASQGQYDAAIFDFDQAIRLDPNNANIFNDRAWTYAHKGDARQALADYDQALRLDPGNTLARDNREALLQGTRSTVGAAPQAQVAAGDGGSIAGAIVIQATSENAGMDAETQWLKRNLPGWRMGTQATVDGPNGRKYDRIEMRGPNGATKTIYFDVTSFYGKD